MRLEAVGGFEPPFTLRVFILLAKRQVRSTFWAIRPSIMCKLPVIPAVRRCSGRLSSAVPPRYTRSWCDIDSIPSFSDAVRYDGVCVPLSQRTISFHVWRVMDSNHRPSAYEADKLPLL